MRTLIIAEAGVNHNGSLRLAKKLIDIAKEAGADYVKFQTFKAGNLVSKSAPKANYQKANTDKDESQFTMLQKLELSLRDHETLIKYCKKKSIEFLSTPFDIDSVQLLKKLGIKVGKIPSGEITNLPYLQAMARAFKKIILSTGMSDLEEIAEALDVLKQSGAKKELITILHCNTEYPTPMKDVNLLAMDTIRKKFGVQVGYSDHTPGIEVPVAAVALGASIIEKHFTIDRTLDGPDHKASLEPGELKEMIRSIRNIESALGNGIKKPSASEKKNKVIARKSIVARKNLPAGHVIMENDFTAKRPGNGFSPMLFPTIIGKKLSRAIAADELLKQTHFE
jgi:N,N'-diacetyllegionaminate synthase